MYDRVCIPSRGIITQQFNLMVVRARQWLFGRSSAWWFSLSGRPMQLIIKQSRDKNCSCWRLDVVLFVDTKMAGADKRVFMVHNSVHTRCSVIADRPRCRVHYSFGQKYKTNWETIFYGQYRSSFIHCDRPGNLSNSVKKSKIRFITAFKVIQGHWRRYQSKARMRLPISD